MIAADRIAIVALAISGISLFVSIIFAHMARQSSIKSRNAEGLVQLHQVWYGMARVTPEVPSVAVPNNSANALKLTASFWIDNSVAKNRIYSTFHTRYETLYEDLFKYTANIGSENYSGRDLLTDEVTKVYREMKEYR